MAIHTINGLTNPKIVLKYDIRGKWLVDFMPADALYIGYCFALHISSLINCATLSTTLLPNFIDSTIPASFSASSTLHPICLSKSKLLSYVTKNQSNIPQKHLIVIGHDTRKSCNIVKTHIIRGIVEAIKIIGCNNIAVLDIGIIPTSLLYFFSTILSGQNVINRTLVKNTELFNRYIVGIMITGSHNSIQYNGCKITINDITLTGKQISDILLHQSLTQMSSSHSTNLTNTTENKQLTAKSQIRNKNNISIPLYDSKIEYNNHINSNVINQLTTNKKKGSKSKKIIKKVKCNFNKIYIDEIYKASGLSNLTHIKQQNSIQIVWDPGGGAGCVAVNLLTQKLQHLIKRPQIILHHNFDTKFKKRQSNPTDNAIKKLVQCVQLLTKYDSMEISINDLAHWYHVFQSKKYNKQHKHNVSITRKQIRNSSQSKIKDSKQSKQYKSKSYQSKISFKQYNIHKKYFKTLNTLSEFGFNVGFAFDGDCDRIVICINGRIFRGDELLFILVYDLLHNKFHDTSNISVNYINDQPHDQHNDNATDNILGTDDNIADNKLIHLSNNRNYSNNSNNKKSISNITASIIKLKREISNYKDISSLHRSMKKFTVIVDVKTSQLIIDKMLQLGIHVVMSGCGHSVIKQTMIATNALIAGEYTGHIFYAKDYYKYDDALFAACKVIHVLINNPSTLIQSIDMLPITYNKSIVLSRLYKDQADFINNSNSIINLVQKFIHILYKKDQQNDIINDDDNNTILDNEEQINCNGILSYNTIDGIRCMHKNGWWLLRASNTERTINLYLECYKELNITQLVKYIIYILSNSISDTIYKSSIDLTSLRALLV